MRTGLKAAMTAGLSGGLLGVTLVAAPAHAAAGDPGLVSLGVDECAQDINGLEVVVTDTHVYRQGRLLPLPGGLDSAVRINDRGDIAGTDDGVAALWRERQLVRIGVADPSDTYSYVTGLNERGDVVGTSGTFGGQSRAFVWTGGAMRVLPGLGGDTGASDINDRGQVSGYAWDGSGAQRAVVWAPDGTLTELGTLGGHSLATALNNRGDVVGYSYTAAAGGSMRAVRWPQGAAPVPVEAPGSVLGIASDINERGRVVGNLAIATGPQQGFVHDATGPVRPVAPLVPGETTVLTAVNDYGTAVGCEFSGEASTAVLRYGPR